MPRTEQTRVRIGIVRLVDCAVIAVAHARGEFRAEGLDVDIQRFESWAAIRDRLAWGEIDAAHMLAPMVTASAAGLGPFPGRFRTAFVLNLNGNAITLSSGLCEAMQEIGSNSAPPFPAAPLARIAAARKARGARPVTLAVVYPFSMHNYELRAWLAAGGVHPDRDVKLIVAPPARMVDLLEAGEVDGYCVGEPWNSEATRRGLGRAVITSGEIIANRPEKVLGVRAEWADSNPDLHQALLRALLRAARWLDAPANRAAAAEIVGAAPYVDLSPERVAAALTGRGWPSTSSQERDLPDFNVFHRYAANFPWRSHAAWQAAQMIRWGHAPRSLDVLAAARAAFDPVPYRVAAEACGVAAPGPDVDLRPLGGASGPWMCGNNPGIVMGPDRFLDGRVFDPARVEDYLEGCTLHAMRATAPAGE